jgi:hypothetical protein
VSAQGPESRPYNDADFDLSNEFLDRLLRGDSAFVWQAAAIAEDPRRFTQGKAFVVGLAVIERVLMHFADVLGIDYKELIEAMSEDLTYGGNESSAPEDIREEATLAGADVEVPEEIEERLAREHDDEAEEIEE